MDWRRGSSAYSHASPSRTGSLNSVKASLTSKYSLGPSPEDWSLPLYIKEEDDALHNPDPSINGRGHVFTFRGLTNLGCIFILVVGFITLFAAYPMTIHFIDKQQSTFGGFNIGGINASGQLPEFPNNFQLIDRDTPQSAYTKKSYHNPDEDMVLVFSDEFNEDGRSFYPGDDPFWEAVDLYYWATEDLEWYDPMQVTTQGGALRLTLDQVDPIDNHNLTYRSGMIQSWNKFCFTGGILEAAVTLPGSSNVGGLWPAVWSMGNLGRAGYGGSLEGMWPYTYDTCDVGTFPNQTFPGTLTPEAAFENGDPTKDGHLSFLQGQKLSSCTCPGQAHPGPIHPDGTFVGRSAPEIDVFEAIVEEGVGKVSLSAQWAPMNAAYKWNNDSEHMIIHDENIILNPFAGNAVQQTTSGLALSNPDCYERTKGCFSVYAFEYKPGFDDGYITWVNDGKPSWTMFAGGLGPDAATQIGRREIMPEPMYIIANLGISPKFGIIDFENLIFPTVMSIDYIRVYQPAGKVNIGCDPKERPTKDYIEQFEKAYTNANLTTWVKEVGEPWPKNKELDGCSA